MAIFLNINTAFETAHIFLSSDNEIIAETQNNSQKDHASFLEPAIKDLVTTANINFSAIDAIAVLNGPGSYTGLRVGLASAKALCYALKKPLILLNTLDVMAYALKLQSPYKTHENILFCPLIDARRMEVFTALYDADLNILKDYSSEILNEHFLEEERKQPVIAGGNGSLKLQKLLNAENIVYINPLLLEKPTAILSKQAYISKKFSDIAYSEPFYLKPVYFRN